MTKRRELDLNELARLAGWLRASPRVARLARTASDQEDVATEAANGLLQIRRACETLSNDLLPRLGTFAPDAVGFSEVLDDIAEEYRVIHYHIVNSRLFNYVVPDADLDEEAG